MATSAVASPAAEMRIAADSDLELLLAPLVTFLAANYDRVVNPTLSGRNSIEGVDSTHRHLVYRLKTSLLSDFNAHHQALFRLVSANHGPGAALRKPMKFNFVFGLGGLNASLAVKSYLVVAIPEPASFVECQKQISSLLKYLLRPAAWPALRDLEDDFCEYYLGGSSKASATFVHGLGQYDPDHQ